MHDPETKGCWGTRAPGGSACRRPGHPSLDRQGVRSLRRSSRKRTQAGDSTGVYCRPLWVYPSLPGRKPPSCLKTLRRPLEMIQSSGGWSSTGPSRGPASQLAIWALPPDQATPLTPPPALSMAPDSSSSACHPRPRCDHTGHTASPSVSIQAPPLSCELPEGRAWSHSAQHPSTWHWAVPVGRWRIEPNLLAIPLLCLRTLCLACHSPRPRCSDGPPQSHPHVQIMHIRPV